MTDLEVEVFDDMNIGEDGPPVRLNETPGRPLPSHNTIGTSHSSTTGFSTPLSQATSQVAADIIGGNVSKWRLLMFEDPESYCRGRINGKTGPVRWCTRTRGCALKSHAESKVDVEPHTWYIQCKANQARAYPSLKDNNAWIPERDRSGLAAKSESLEVWITYFESVMVREIQAAEKDVGGQEESKSGSGRRIFADTVDIDDSDYEDEFSPTSWDECSDR